MATTEAILILLAFFKRFDLETKEIAHSIPVGEMLCLRTGQSE